MFGRRRWARQNSKENSKLKRLDDTAALLGISNKIQKKIARLVLFFVLGVICRYFRHKIQKKIASYLNVFVSFYPRKKRNKIQKKIASSKSTESARSHIVCIHKIQKKIARSSIDKMTESLSLLICNKIQKKIARRERRVWGGRRCLSSYKIQKKIARLSFLQCRPLALLFPVTKFKRK